MSQATNLPHNASFSPTLWVTRPVTDSGPSITEELDQSDIFPFESDQSTSARSQTSSIQPRRPLNSLVRASTTVLCTSRSSNRHTIIKVKTTPSYCSSASSIASHSPTSTSSSEQSFVWPSTPEAEAIEKSWTSSIDSSHARPISLTGAAPKIISQKRRKYPRTMSSHHLHSSGLLRSDAGRETARSRSLRPGTAVCPSASRLGSSSGHSGRDAGGYLEPGTSMRASARSISMPDLRLKPEFMMTRAKRRGCVDAVIYVVWTKVVQRCRNLMRSGVEKLGLSKSSTSL